MNPKTFSRRRALIGGGVILGLPFLESVAPRRASAGGASTKRFVLLSWPEGRCKHVGSNEDFTLHQMPAANASVNNFNLPPSLASLGEDRDKLIIFRGVDNSAAGPQPQPHDVASQNVFTGGSPNSIDQVIAKSHGDAFTLRSLELGVNAPQASTRRVIFSNGDAVPCINEPSETFARIFGSGAGEDMNNAEFQGLLARRQSVIDAVKDQLDSLQGQISISDRHRLDAHLTAVEQAERELIPEDITAPYEGCQDPQSPGLPQNLDELTKRQLDLMVLALACGRTPVASLQWAYTGSQENFDWLSGGPGALHGWVHNDTQSNEYVAKWKASYTWMMNQVAYLVEGMKAVDEGGQTLFDNTAILSSSSYGTAGRHDPVNAPYLVVGDAGGALQTGQFLNFNGVPANRLFLALARAYGIELSSFGNSDYGTSPLPDVSAV